jgi:WD40 repeat protein
VAALLVLVLLLSAAGFALVTTFWRAAVRQEGLALDRAVDEARARAEAVTQKKRAQKSAAEARRRQKEAEEARSAKEAELDRARRTGFTAQVLRAAESWERNPRRGLLALDDEAFCPPELRDFAWGYYRRLCQRQVRCLTDPKTAVAALALSRDGKTLATRTATGKLQLWDLARRRPGPVLVARDTGHRAAEGSTLAFSPDGKLLASGGGDSVKLWDVAAGKEKATFRWTFPDGKPRQVHEVTFSPDGKALAVAGAWFDAELYRKESDSRWRGGVIWLWDVQRGTPTPLFALATGPGSGVDHLSGFSCLAFSPDGKTVAAGTTRSSDVKLIDVATKKLRRRIWTQPGWIGCVAFSPDGKTLAFGNSTSNVFLADPATGKVHSPWLVGHLGHVGTVAFTADGKTLVSVSGDTLKRWDARSGHLLATLHGRARVGGLALLGGGRQAVAGTPAGAWVWELTPRREQDTLGGESKGVLALAFSGNGKRLAGAGQDGVVRLWQVGSRQRPIQLRGHADQVTGVALDAAGAVVVSAGVDWTVRLWQLGSGKPAERELNGHTGPVVALALTPDGRTLVTGSADRTVRLWDVPSGKCLHVFTCRRPVRSLALSADGRVLLAGGAGNAQRWDVPRRRELAVPAGLGPADGVALTSDGRTAAVLGRGRVVLWDVGGGAARPPLREVEGTPLALAFTRDGRTLAVGCADRKVRIYDVVTGHLRAELAEHGAQVRAVAFAPDGALLASASASLLRWDQRGDVKLWPAPRVPGRPGR